MNLKETFLDKFNLFVEKKSSEERVKKLLKKLLPYKINTNLVRIGEKNDGGYLVPEDFEGIKINYSAGVGMLTKFEADLINNYSIYSKMLDYNEIDRSIIPNGCDFIKKKLSLRNNSEEISINNWLDTNDKEIMLKLDIEGGEYQVLSEISQENMNKIRILIIEFHNLRDLRSAFFLSFFENLIEKLESYFYVCHVHINNTSNIKKIGKLKIPDMLEVTLIKKNRVKNFRKVFSKLPHDLDSKTDINRKEIFIDKYWYE